MIIYLEEDNLVGARRGFAAQRLDDTGKPLLIQDNGLGVILERPQQLVILEPPFVNNRKRLCHRLHNIHEIL